MDLCMIRWSVVVFVSWCRAAPVSESVGVSVGAPHSVQRGHAATLPCWLNPPQSAEDLEVRWYRDHFDVPVMLYKAKKFETGSQEASYVGRVSFGLKDTTSGGLKSGDVSLKLDNVTIKDAGDYTCYASSFQEYDSSTVNLRVTETGRSPLLSFVWKEDNMVNVSCESEGWYPRPELQWSDQTQDLTHNSVVHSEVTSGLYSVHSWLLAPGSSDVSCSIGLPNMVAKEARMHIRKTPEKESSTGGWVAFGILLIIALAVLGALYYRKRGKKSTECSKENEPLLSNEPTALSAARKFYENIKLEDTGNEYLKIKGNILRDASVGNFQDGESVPCLTAIKGTTGFSEGQHYWEVSLGKEGAGLKKSWWIGVTSVTENLQKNRLSPNTSNHFWFLSSSEDTLQFSTEPPVSLPVQSRPKTVGVLLDCAKGNLSFYDVEKNRLIGSFITSFKEKVFPFFNPGKGDAAPMEILHKLEQSSDKENAVDLEGGEAISQSTA
ncbi:butyrophilin subfamily 3 member A2-like [Odontesthes bonariensis]|uniref:butyrophilin subfamily 3 member A2-like n=1 Tax=Odontesthes bonariensis TaxID=219752 RepID=UPI003F58E016